MNPMNFLKMKTTWTNLELVPFKVAIASAYVLLGAYFHEYIRAYYLAVVVLFFVSTIPTIYKWFKKLKSEN